jgi:hypothetical protein
MRLINKALALALLVLLWLPQAPAAAAPDEMPVVRIKGTVRFVSGEKIYCILADSGKKYQPMRRLPRAFQKDGLKVVVDARVREDIIGMRMWGTALEVLNISKASTYISPEDREAVKLLLERMDAFNSRDLAKLQKIDQMAGALAPSEFDAWLAGYGNFTLCYVETGDKVDNTIQGTCLYSRELTSGMALSGNINYAIMNFTLTKAGDAWRFSATSSFRPGPGIDLDQYTAELLDKAKQRFGTTNLARWKGKAKS